MPLYDFRCNTCETTFELLAKAGSAPGCPECGATLEKLVSAPQAPGKTAGILASARSQALREGHFSHYSKAERAKIK
jgi:putative FmdB family regulatory protein